MILRGQHRHDRLAITERHERNFLPIQTLFDQHFTASFAKRLIDKHRLKRRSGFVVDGHARVALALTRGEATVPVLYVDLEPDEEALVLATLDPLGTMATADEGKLYDLLADVTGDDLPTSGFNWSAPIGRRPG